MLALIVGVCLGAIYTLGTNVGSAYNTVGQSIGSTFGGGSFGGDPPFAP